MAVPAPLRLNSLEAAIRLFLLSETKVTGRILIHEPERKVCILKRYIITLSIAL